MAGIWLLSCVWLEASGELVKMRYPEGPAHGFLVLSDTAGTALAYGELTQWLRRSTVVSRLVFNFDDGSLYDETVRFAQSPSFRLLSYRLRQQGPSFTETTDVWFDRSGSYRVRRRPAPDKDEQHARGTHAEVPEDVTNGMTSILLKNLPRGVSATTHFLTFGPEPRVLELHLTPEGSEQYWVGRVAASATRYLIEPRVTGLTGALATVVGKQPPTLRMWIAQGKSPTLVKFEGPLYADGPEWRIEHTGPRWQRP